MKKSTKYFLIGVIASLILFLVNDLKNYLMFGSTSIVNDDIFDKLIFYLELPGQIPTFILVIIIYQNIHNYNYNFAWITSLVFNSLFYGFIFCLVMNIISKFRQRRLEDSPSRNP